jgi:hypothetical protein
MASSPVVEWREVVSPNSVVGTLALTGSAFSGAIPVGTSSNVVSIRVYNNFAAATGIADALSCVLAAYDDAIHEGQATSTPTSAKYLQVSVTDYNGISTGGDGSIYYAIGGATKHTLPVNGGTLGGGAANYATVNLKVVIPATATQGNIVQGLWIEYSSTS